MNKEELEELYSIAFEDKTIQSEAIKKHIKKQEQEIDRLNNIINELEKYCEENSKLDHGSYDRYGDVLDKLKELKENNNDSYV